MGKEKRQSPSTLLWFIRHKSYVPISEIRRRFFIESEDGSFIEAGGHRRAYVGLPPGTAQSLEKLWQQGKIGLELSAEFDANVLIGVYPMVPAKEHLNGHAVMTEPRRPIMPSLLLAEETAGLDEGQSEEVPEDLREFPEAANS